MSESPVGRSAAISGGTPPRIVGIGQLIEIAPVIKTQPLVGLAHQHLINASDVELTTHIRTMFEACWDEGLTASEALSLVCGSYVGIASRFRKLTPTDLWERFGRPSHEARLRFKPALSPAPVAALAPEWWGSRFEVWSASVAQELPTSFRHAVAWSALSTLLGEHVATPIGPPHLSVALAGQNSRARDDARRLGGTLKLSIDSYSLASLSSLTTRLTAAEPDMVIGVDALRERQGPQDHSTDPILTRLVAEALDGLERAQAAAEGILIVRSSDEALDLVTTLRTDLAQQLRTLDPDIVDEMLSGSSLLVRRMAVLVAVSEGDALVSEAHQGIAIEAARESVSATIHRLVTGRWAA